MNQIFFPLKIKLLFRHSLCQRKNWMSQNIEYQISGYKMSGSPCGTLSSCFPKNGARNTISRAWRQLIRARWHKVENNLVTLSDFRCLFSVLPILAILRQNGDIWTVLGVKYFCWRLAIFWRFPIFQNCSNKTLISSKIITKFSQNFHKIITKNN